MGTRCLIALQRPDGTIVTIHCHFDGHLKHTGAVLIEHYTNLSKIEELLSLGDLWYIQPHIHPDPKRPHNLENAQENVSVFLGRDSEHPKIEARTYRSFEPWFDENNVDYHFLFSQKEGKWFTFDWNTDKMRPLTEVLAERRATRSPSASKSPV